MTHDYPMSRYITTEQAANYCGFSPRTFEKYRVTGEGPRYIKRGKKVLYAVEELESWMRDGLRRSTTHTGRAA